MVRHASYRSSAVVQLLAELSSTISCFGCLPHSRFISRSVWIRYVSLLHAIALRPLHNARSRPPEAGLRRLPSSFYQSRLPQLWTCGLKNRVHACPLACSTTCGVGLPCGFADIAITLYLRICGKAGNSAFAAFASPPAIKRYDTDVPGTYRHMHLRCRSCRCTANDGWPMPIDSCRHIGAGDNRPPMANINLLCNSCRPERSRFNWPGGISLLQRKKPPGCMRTVREHILHDAVLCTPLHQAHVASAAAEQQANLSRCCCAI